MTRTLIHKSPLGPLVIPGVLGEPGPGEPFEVDDDIAEALLKQSDLYAPAPATELPDLNVDQLRQHARDHGIPLDGARKKPDIIAAIARHTETVDDVDGPTEDPQEGGDQK
jgi:hypothetical protein